ncbi:putative endo-xylogalacturonan hydrolase A [Aspergillus spectabilis]
MFPEIIGSQTDYKACPPSQSSAGAAVNVVEKRAVCTPASLGSSQLDDTPAIKAAITSCGNGGTIVIPAGTTYSLRTMLDFTGCNNCDFQLEGTLKSSTDTTYWATQPAIIYLNKISGAKIRSLTGSGVIDGNGQTAYDIFAVDSSLARPTVVYIVGGSSDITISGFKVKNPPNVFFGQKGAVKNINYASLTMTAASKSTNLPKNTDGFDRNQDDCIAFKSGANYVTVDRVTYAGTNHGTNVYVTDLTMTNCGKAAGIKLYPGGSSHGTAAVTNVTWDGVTVDGCDYGVQIQSCYGTSAEDSPVVAILNCPAAGTCGLSFSSWDVDPPSGLAEILCDNIEGDSGITCVPGASG